MAAALHFAQDQRQPRLASPHTPRYALPPSPLAAATVFSANPPEHQSHMQTPLLSEHISPLMQPPTALQSHHSHHHFANPYLQPASQITPAPLSSAQHPQQAVHGQAPQASVMAGQHVSFDSPPRALPSSGQFSSIVGGSSKLFATPPSGSALSQQSPRFVPHRTDSTPLPPPHMIQHQFPQTHAHPLDPYADTLLLSDSSYCALPAQGVCSLPSAPAQHDSHLPTVYYGPTIAPLAHAQAPLTDLSLQSILAVPPMAVEQQQQMLHSEDKLLMMPTLKTQHQHAQISPCPPQLGGVPLVHGQHERDATQRESHVTLEQQMNQHHQLARLPLQHEQLTQQMTRRPELQHRQQQAQTFSPPMPHCAPLISCDDSSPPSTSFFSAPSAAPPPYGPDPGSVVPGFPSPAGMPLQQAPTAAVSRHQFMRHGSSGTAPTQQVVFSVTDSHLASPAMFAQHGNESLTVQAALSEDPGVAPLSYIEVPQQQPASLLLSPLQGPVEHVMPQTIGHVHDVDIHTVVQQPVVSAPNVLGVPDLLAGTQFTVAADLLEPYMGVGRACRDIGRNDLAAATFRACMTICPESNEARAAYNSSVYGQGFYESALDVGPVFPEDVFNDVGNSLRSMGRSAEAEMAYRAALNIAPRHAHAWNNLGNAMRGRGAILDAMQCYTASLSAQPGFAAAHCNLAGLLRDQGKPQEAEGQYRAALLSDPNLAEAAAGLGTALRDMGRTEEAISFYVRAVSLQPDAADHHANLANTHKDLNRIEESIVSYQAALALQPDLPDAFCNMVHSLSVICDWTNREQNFATLLDIIDRQLDTLLHHPATNPRLYNTLVGALSNSTPQLVDVCGGSRSDRDNASVSATTSREENSMDRVPRRKYVHHPSSPSVVKNAKRRGKFARFVTSAPSVVAPVLTSGLPSVQPFHALIYPMSPEKFRALSAAYASRAESMVAGIPPIDQRWSAPRGLGVRLKVGYVSSDYNNHPYSHLTQSIYGLHGTGSTVECFCYALTPSDQSAWRLRIEREVEHFRDISGMTAKQSGEAIARDGIHVLVNCNGYTKGARTELFALRPAPVQVSFMGFPGTLGAHYIEYFITDVVTSPPQIASRMHSEALLYHPHSYFVNDHRQTSVPGPKAFPSGPLTRAHYGLPEDCFLFIMHNQLYKLSPDTFDVWARILRRVPGSKLWLLRFPPTGEQRIRQEAAARGLDPDRLIFTDVAGKDEHVARAGLGDLFLDTPTCNAHTTGTDVLWSGVPMITCPGSLFASRVAASLLTAAGVPELIAADMLEYEDLAVELATNRPKLAAIRARIESSRFMNALFDTERWVRNVEALYWLAWKNFEDGKAPTHIFGKDVYDGSTMVSRPAAVESVYSTTDSRQSESLRYGNIYNSGVAT